MKDRLAQLRADARRAGWAHYIRTANDERALLAGCRVERGLGEHVCRFFETYCRHSKGRWAGQPFVLAPWQRDDIVMPLFSWVRPNGRRRFRSADIWVPKKNGKSTLASGLGLYFVKGDNEKGAEVYYGANDKEQAGIVFGASLAMVEVSPALLKGSHINRNEKRISWGSATWVRALSADVAKQEGLNIHALVVDELHAFDERGRTRFEAWRYGGAAREQPMTVVISTAGEDEAGIGYEQYEMAKAVLDGTLEDTGAFAYIREMGKDDDWTDPAVHESANPGYGDILDPQELAEQCSRAQQIPSLRPSFLRYRLGRWVQTTNPWLEMGCWDDCDEKLDPAKLLGAPCGAGIDAGSTRDLTALALCFPVGEEDDQRFAFVVHHWLPEDSLRTFNKAEATSYRLWAERGWLTLTPGNATDYGFVQAKALEMADKHNVIEWGFDVWNFRDRAQTLQDEHGLKMVEMRQGVQTMGEPSKDFERLVLQGRIIHGGNPLLRIQASRVRVKRDVNDNIQMVKGENRTKLRHRIDGIVACVMALARARAMKAPVEVTGDITWL